MDSFALNDIADALLAFADDGFSEADHVMTFPRSQGFVNARQVHRGNVFSRALIAEALCELSLVDARAGVYVDREIEHLLSLRRTDGSGWAYFPELMELPSDADDLAAVIRAISCARGIGEAATLTREPLYRWLERARRDGIVSSWIPSNDPSVRERQEQWTKTTWGDTYDVEVAANAIVALETLGASGTVIDALRAAVAAQQRDGAWSSTWYWGPFYATMMCSQALAGDALYGDALARASQFLAASRKADGGWGIDAQSDPLNTAFALLTLRAIASRADSLDVCGIARGGLTALAAQSVDRAVPFIRMELGRAQGSVRQTLSYGSGAITAAFSVKSLLAWRPT
ncbi:MAG TPA: prenyltransferase/squalene oxidase repeat-containing protein [Candidatus Baltobacteraceae bacterium]|nr:prenyltransferase/squalene oxidase repeat-containing protein [Candidatus Baltobacteraceae bacterium]